MEALGQKIKKAVEKKYWKTYKMGKEKLRVPHLFFADDLLLIGEASHKQAAVMFRILQTFCAEFGQKVNESKSRVRYSPNTPINVRLAVLERYGVKNTSNLEKYLRIPFCHGRVQQHFGYLIDKVMGRLSRWKSRLLSQAARLILIQLVTTAIPGYTMQACKLLA